MNKIRSGLRRHRLSKTGQYCIAPRVMVRSSSVGEYDTSSEPPVALRSCEEVTDRSGDRPRAGHTLRIERNLHFLRKSGSHEANKRR